MKRLGHYLFVQQRHNWVLLFRFGLVGGSGVVVNLLVFGLIKHFFVDAGAVFFGLPGTDKAVRWYHVYSTIAFLFANVWNFQLNRKWTFGSGQHASWWHEYAPFLLVGFMGQFINLVVLTLLLHQGSPIELSASVFNGANLVRDRELFAQLIAVAVVTPISFVLNKLWVFSSVRGIQGGRGT
ncbi:MAG: GtrA family protein [Thermoleophilia bacterium]|nr:GtrA family protein [Thermoleophilia bacterium]